MSDNDPMLPSDAPPPYDAALPFKAGQPLPPSAAKGAPCWVPYSRYDQEVGGAFDLYRSAAASDRHVYLAGWLVRWALGDELDHVPPHFDALLCVDELDRGFVRLAASPVLFRSGDPGRSPEWVTAEISRRDNRSAGAYTWRRIKENGYLRRLPDEPPRARLGRRQ